MMNDEEEGPNSRPATGDGIQNVSRSVGSIRATTGGTGQTGSGRSGAERSQSHSTTGAASGSRVGPSKMEAGHYIRYNLPATVPDEVLDQLSQLHPEIEWGRDPRPYWVPPPSMDEVIEAAARVRHSTYCPWCPPGDIQSAHGCKGLGWSKDIPYVKPLLEAACVPELLKERRDNRDQIERLKIHATALEHRVTLIRRYTKRWAKKRANQVQDMGHLHQAMLPIIGMAREMARILTLPERHEMEKLEVVDIAWLVELAHKTLDALAEYDAK